MELKWEEMLKQHARDENSFEKLRQLFTGMLKKKEKCQQDLNLLEAAIENDYDSILITDLGLEEPGPRIVYVNEGFTRMTGYSKEEVIGKTPRILQGPKTDRAVLDRLKSCLEAGKPFFGQTVNYRKDGSEFVNQWDIHPMTDEEGNITHWVSYQHDITDRKRAEKVFVNTKAEFDELRETSHKTVIDVDLEGNIISANKAFRVLVGYSKEELRQVKVWELFARKFRDSLESRFREGVDDEKFRNRTFSGVVRHKSGIPIQIEGTTNLLDLKDQTLIRAEIDNISMQKRVIDTLRQKNENYFRIVEKASEFTYRLQLEDGTPVFESLSEKFPLLTGLSPEAVCCKNGYRKFVHEADQEKVVSHYRKVLKGKSCTCSYRIRAGEEEYVEIIDYSRPEWDSQSQSVVCIRGAVSLKAGEQPTA